jgi:hypothetical protein
MSFEIRATDIGPIIVHNDEFIALTSEDALIEFCYEDGTRLDAIQDHIKEELENALDLYIEGFMMGINPPAGKLYAYIAAFQQYWMFKHIRFSQYLTAVREAEEE